MGKILKNKKKLQKLITYDVILLQITWIST